MDARQIRGMEIAEQGRITQTKKGWNVPSQYGSGSYTVEMYYNRSTCDCPDCQTRQVKCKHQWAVEYFAMKKTDKEGNTEITKAVKITYPQNWKAYTAAQTQEIEMFDVLLKDLLKEIDEPEQGMGRPRLTLQSQFFCSIQKVYSQLSSRRAQSLYRNARDREQIGKAPSYNTVNIFLNREDITPMLHRMLTLSALPLKSVESSFSPDSSGFSTTKFGEYCRQKHRDRKYHKWVKAHILVGSKTNIIASAVITQEDGADSPQFRPLVNDAHNSGFEIKEIQADKAYSSRDNHDIADGVGATAYIPFKTNATGTSKGSLIWSKAYHYFMFKREEFLDHYHKRSNVETAFMMIKSKFGEKLKSKNWIAQKNEMLCKLIAHNIVVLIHEMHELGITPDFSGGVEKKEAVVIGFSPCGVAK